MTDWTTRKAELASIVTGSHPMFGHATGLCESDHERAAGGDVLLLASNVVAIGVGSHTSTAAMERLTSQLFEIGFAHTVLAVLADPDSAECLDKRCTIVGAGIALVRTSAAFSLVARTITQREDGLRLSHPQPFLEAAARAMGLDQLRVIDTGPFEACYKAEFTPLVVFLLRQGVPYHDAHDAAQTAFTEAVRQWERIWAPRAWLRRVAVRSVKRLPELPVEDISVGDQALLPDDIDVKEQTRDVLKKLSQLPPQQRTVMAWTLDGFSPAEIAAEIKSTPEAVRQNLHRARQTLKTTFSQERKEGR